MNLKNNSLVKTVLNRQWTVEPTDCSVVNRQTGSTIDVWSFLTLIHRSHDMGHVTNGVAFNSSTQQWLVIHFSHLVDGLTT